MKMMLQCLTILFLVFVSTGCGTEETAVKELELQAGDFKQLVIDNRNGEIQISGNSESDKIEVKAQAKAKGVSMDKLKLKLEGRGEAAYLDASFEGQFLAMGSGLVDLQIKVPKHLGLEMTSHRNGNIHISGMSASAKIENINGDIQVSNTAGPLDIENRDGDITIRDTASDVKIVNINGHITVDQVGGSADIDVGDGTLELDRVAKDAVIRQSGSGQVTIGDVKGKVTQNK